MTPDQAADILDVTQGQILRLRRRGQLTGRKRRIRQVYYVRQGRTVIPRRRWIHAWDIDGLSVRRLKRQRNR